ncbi:MAG: MoxR family ATPase, partial [Chloroflexota bacterium]
MNSNGFDQFRGSRDYVTSEPLRNAVNASIALSRPLLVRGEPGTGKTLLAHSIAGGLQKRLLVWNIKSTTKAQEGLYVYDTVQRLNDSRFGNRDVSDIKRYIKLGKLGQAFTSPEQVVLLIDEVDKADIEFPNDLLNELDEMSFYITETDETITAIHRPVTLITSNAEKELPDAFLRRCVFHYIEFPTPELMEAIVRVHFPDIKNSLLREAIKTFYSLRKVEE